MVEGWRAHFAKKGLSQRDVVLLEQRERARWPRADNPVGIKLLAGNKSTWALRTPTLQPRSPPARLGS